MKTSDAVKLLTFIFDPTIKPNLKFGVLLLVLSVVSYWKSPLQVFYPDLECINGQWIGKGIADRIINCQQFLENQRRIVYPSTFIVGLLFIYFFKVKLLIINILFLRKIKYFIDLNCEQIYTFKNKSINIKGYLASWHSMSKFNRFYVIPIDERKEVILNSKIFSKKELSGSISVYLLYLKEELQIENRLDNGVKFYSYHLSSLKDIESLDSIFKLS